MGHIPEDENFEEYMNASADEWSKPEEPTAEPKMEDEQVDRWGSPIAEEANISDQERWGSEGVEPAQPDFDTQAKKSSTKWWIIALIIAIVLCLCVCILLVGLPFLGINMFGSNLIQF